AGLRRAQRWPEQTRARGGPARLPRRDLVLRLLPDLRRPIDLQEVVTAAAGRGRDDAEDQGDSPSLAHAPVYTTAMELAREAYVDGRWQRSSRTFAVRDPYDDALIAEVADCDDAMIDAAVPA